MIIEHTLRIPCFLLSTYIHVHAHIMWSYLDRHYTNSRRDVHNIHQMLGIIMYNHVMKGNIVSLYVVRVNNVSIVEPLYSGHPWGS